MPPCTPRKVRTPAEEIWLSVQQWYFSRGLKIPSEEEASCKNDIAREKQETDYVAAFLTKANAEDELSIVKHENSDDVYAKSAECVGRWKSKRKICRVYDGVACWLGYRFRSITIATIKNAW